MMTSFFNRGQEMYLGHLQYDADGEPIYWVHYENKNVFYEVILLADGAGNLGDVIVIYRVCYSLNSERLGNVYARSITSFTDNTVVGTKAVPRFESVTLRELKAIKKEHINTDFKRKFHAQIEEKEETK